MVHQEILNNKTLSWSRGSEEHWAKGRDCQRGAHPVPGSGGGSSCVQLCFPLPLRGPWVFLRKRGVVLLPVWLPWYHESRGDSWHLFVPLVITRRGEIRDWKWTECLRSGSLSARFMEVWFLISLLCGRKSDNFAFQCCQSHAFPRRFTYWKVVGEKEGSQNVRIPRRRATRRCLIGIWC